MENTRKRISLTTASFLISLFMFSGLIFSSFITFAASGAEHSGEKDFNPGEMIIHHISDAHQIHIIGSVYIPLPVIVYHKGHLDCFMSCRFWAGTDENNELIYQPYTAPSGITYQNHHEVIEVVSSHDHGHTASDVEHHTTENGVNHEHHTMVAGVEESSDSLALSLEAVAAESADHAHRGHGVKALDFSITKSVFGMLLVIVLMIVIFRSVAKSYEKRKGLAPKGLQNLVEPLILFIRNEVAIPSIGKKKADRYTPFLLTIFFFIWMCNLLGLVPFIGGFNITGTLSITLTLAAIVFIITSVSGNKHYWGHIFWPPGVPLLIKFILVPIEFMSVFIKPTVLMIRLTANIAAGHIIILAFVGLVLLFGQSSAAMGYGVGVGAVLFMVFMFLIELLVAFLQAYVFTLLAALYFGDATQEHHHDDHH
ncbi:MAG: F0F1 ATP synthase subunit A [Crocinitomicaceae bacterium]|nr:F0F1 ATP synthase subunit A [Crocinitomicaceae bacterium]